MVDLSGNLLDVNDSYVNQSGYSREELLQMKVSDLEYKEKAEETRAHIEKIVTEGHDLFESWHKRKDGVPWPVEIKTNYWPIGEGILFVFITDISKRLKKDEELRLLVSVFNHSGEAMLISDSRNRIIKVNPAFTELTGYSLEEIEGKNPSVLSAGYESREFYKEMWNSIMTGDNWQGEIYDKRKDGTVYPKMLSITTIRDEQNKIVNYIGSFFDISDRKHAENEIKKLAYSDTLTGLHNRLSILATCEAWVDRAKKDNERIAIFFMDLDRFKVINDTLGHQIGDLLLQSVGQRIKENVRDSDPVGRFGGDEFIILMDGFKSADDISYVAKKLVRELSRPFLVEGHVLYTSPSIGIAVFPDDGSSVSLLMRNADTAMYQSKNDGGKGYKFFSAAMSHFVAERMEVETGLYRALENGEFALHYQPQYNENLEISGLEALIRWSHPTKGLIPPDQFIPIAEETGIIKKIGMWVIQTVCDQIADWNSRGIRSPRVAINLSVHEFLQHEFVKVVQDLLDRARVDGTSLEFEITERSAMTNPEEISNVMVAIKGLGIRISVDDFGTGYSSLAYLGKFPIDTLKLDRTFIQRMQVEPSSMAITLSSIDLARKLGMEVIAEGVETEEQSLILFQAGCNSQQGYHFSKPLPPDEVETLLARDPG